LQKNLEGGSRKERSPRGAFQKTLQQKTPFASEKGCKPPCVRKAITSHIEQTKSFEFLKGKGTGSEGGRRKEEGGRDKKHGS